MPAMIASSTWAVQMLLVAFSRRMCCSRVWRARRKAGLPWASLRDADDAAGHLAGVFGLGGHEGGVRAAEAHRDAEALGGADGDVRAEFAGRLDEREREQVGGDDDQGAGGVGLRRLSARSRRCGRRCRDIARGRRRGRSLEVVGFGCGSPTTTSMPSDSARVRDDGDGLRMAVVGDEEALRARRSTRRWHMAIASAAAVASSSSEALARGRPVRSATIVWKLSSASRRPWEISAW